MALSSVLVIPARYESSRLPGKPLIPLLGVSMIRRTYQQCAKVFPHERIYVATDDDRIRQHCEAYGIQVLMTPADCPTGTDRIACVAQMVEADLFINVQGDEPVFDPVDLARMLEATDRYPGEVLNGVCLIDDEALFRNPSTPKVVARPDGRLLYMSRAAIPTTKQLVFKKSWRQVCVYAFPRAALQAFYSTGGKTELEAIEDIEILRFLEIGYDVRMVPLSSQSVAVDTPDDIPRAEAAIARLGLAELD